MVHHLSVTIPSRIHLTSPAKRTLGNSSAVNFANSTAIDASPQIICPENPGSHIEYYVITKALHWHRANVRQALAQVERGVNFPTFRAIFKSNYYSARISGVLERTLEMPKPPVFICIRSEAEAQDYETRVPGLWQQCNSGRSTWGTEIALFLCPEFLRRGQTPGAPMSKACPTVMANEFRTVPMKPTLFGNRAYEITKYLLDLENTFDPYQASQDPNVYMNTPLGWNAEDASQRALSYVMYIQCGSKTCSHCC